MKILPRASTRTKSQASVKSDSALAGRRHQRAHPQTGVFWTRSRKEALAAFLFILPDSLGLLIFVGIPMLLALSLGFFSVDRFCGYKFVGFANYNRMLHDPLFLNSLFGTVLYSFLLFPYLHLTAFS